MLLKQYKRNRDSERDHKRQNAMAIMDDGQMTEITCTISTGVT